MWLTFATDDRRRPRSGIALSAVSAVALLLAGGFSLSAGSGLARAASQPSAVALAPKQPEPINCSPTDSAGELPSGSWSIGGLVTDGIGNPVADILVAIDVTNVGRRTTYTTAEGRYLFQSLDNATYDVSFFDQTGVYESGFYDGGPTALSPATGTQVTVSGADATGIDATLAAESFHTISGSVADSSAAMLPGVLVRASGVYFPLVGCYSTDADGTFAIPNLRAGVYKLGVQASGEPDGFYDDATPTTHFSIHDADATDVTVPPDPTGIYIQFPTTYSLTGAVFDESSVGVGDVGVSACPVGGGGCGYATSNPADGSFEVPALVEGSYIVGEQDNSGLNRFLAGYYAGVGLFSATSAGALAVAVPGASIQLLAVAAPQVSGTITDASGGVNDITVSLCDPDQNCFEASTGSDNTGRYQAGIPVAGTYVARIIDNSQNHPSGGYIPATGTEVTPVEAQARQITVGNTSLINEDAFLPAGGRIQVSVTSGGQPVPDELVQFCRAQDVCPDGLNADPSGVALSPAMFTGDYAVQATIDYQSFFWYRSDIEIASLDFSLASPVSVANDGSTTSIVMEVPAAGTQTDPGGAGVPVTVALDDGTGTTPVSVTFPEVTGSGTTTLTTSETGVPIPDGFQLGLPATYFDISTTATFNATPTSPITVCISYDGITFLNGQGLKLYHYDSAIPGWQDITVLPVDTVHHIICGLTTSLSPFVIVEPSFSFGGFFGPKAPPQLNDAKAGDTIGVQFGMGGDAGLSIFADGTPTSTQVDCTTGAEIGATQATTGTLKYNRRTARYTYSWTTNQSWKGTCRELTFTFQDGSTATVWYRLGPVSRVPKPHGHGG